MTKALQYLTDVHKRGELKDFSSCHDMNYHYLWLLINGRRRAGRITMVKLEKVIPIEYWFEDVEK